MALTNATCTINSSSSVSTSYTANGPLLPTINYTSKLLAGVGASQANCTCFTDFTVASGTPKLFDLIGGELVQPDGSAFGPNAVKEMVIQNRDPANSLTVGGGANAWATWLGGTSQTIVIPAGGILVITAPLAGYAVTASTGDMLQITASAGTVPATIKFAGVQ